MGTRCGQPSGLRVGPMSVWLPAGWRGGRWLGAGCRGLGTQLCGVTVEIPEDCTMGAAGHSGKVVFLRAQLEEQLGGQPRPVGGRSGPGRQGQAARGDRGLEHTEPISTRQGQRGR